MNTKDIYMGQRVQVTTYLTEDGFARLKALAERQQRSISYMAGAAIGAYVIQAETAITAQGIAQARVVDPAQIDLEEAIAGKTPAKAASSSVKSIPVRNGKRK